MQSSQSSQSVQNYPYFSQALRPPITEPLPYEDHPQWGSSSNTSSYHPAGGQAFPQPTGDWASAHAHQNHAWASEGWNNGVHQYPQSSSYNAYLPQNVAPDLSSFRLETPSSPFMTSAPEAYPLPTKLIYRNANVKSPALLFFYCTFSHPLARRWRQYSTRFRC